MECVQCGSEVTKIVAKGMCGQCYSVDLARRSVAICGGCNERKPLKAKGYCSACYMAFLRYGDPTHRERPKKGANLCSKCERYPVHAKGLCKVCYGKGRLLNLGHGECSNCKKFKKLMAKGLCNKCYALSLEESKTKKCRGCGEVKPIKAQGFCRKCFARKKRHGHTNRTRLIKGTKLCTVCGKKPIHAKKMCGACYAKHRDVINPEMRTNADLKRHFGITIDDYNRMLEYQNFCCAICGKRVEDMDNGMAKRFDVDHDHSTGKIRGLLCGNCNRGIGNLQDSPENLQSAIQYLKTHASSEAE